MGRPVKMRTIQMPEPICWLGCGGHVTAVEASPPKQLARGRPPLLPRERAQWSGYKHKGAGDACLMTPRDDSVVRRPYGRSINCCDLRATERI